MALLVKLQQKCSSLLRSTGRKVTFSILAFLVLLYFASSWIQSRSHRYIVLDRQARCVEDSLTRWYNRTTTSDAFIHHDPQLGQQDNDKYFLPYVGNGYIGISIDGNHGVWLKGDRGLDIPTDFNPLGRFTIRDFPSKQATVLDVKGGKIERYRCFQDPNSIVSSCITLTHRIYAHRTRPGLLVQDVDIYNPTDKNIEVTVTQDTITSWASESSKLASLPKSKGLSDEDWVSGSKTLASSVLLSVAGMQFPTSGVIELRAKGSVTMRSHTVFDYVVSDAPKASNDFISQRKAHTVKALETALELDNSALDAEHKRAWRELWKSGFTISDSKAPEALNADVINSTLYYILSHVYSVLSSVTTNDKEREQAMSRLNAAESCYNNPQHTLQFSSLWQIGDTVESMNHGVDTHLKSMEKYGCSGLVNAGAEGVLQAVLLSLGGLKFSTMKDQVIHLEFNADPADLHRDYNFRNIRYGNMTTVNISVIVDDENYPVLHVSASTPGLYACDPRLDTPKPLGSDIVTLKVLLTKPLSSILYISHDIRHFGDLKQVVQHIEIPKLAPAHDHRVMALHKHGHSYGGLPAAFWVVLVVLLVVFHIFLFKMIFNEYFNNQPALPTYRKRTFS